MTMTPDPRPGHGPAPAASHSPGVLDEPTLDRLRELDPTGAARLMERVVAAYDSSLGRLLPDLVAARAGEAMNLSVVRHVSHTLKSSSASLGALHLADRCAEIETIARKGETEGLDALLDNMLIEIEQVRLALKALLN
jgi:HPt (histidine-containing phosphotransfer) domain-containing protein